MTTPFSCRNHGCKHSKRRRKSKFSIFSTRGRRSTKVRGSFRENSACTACSSSMAGGEVHVSFSASSQTQSVQPVMPNCQFSNCTIRGSGWGLLTTDKWPKLTTDICTPPSWPSSDDNSNRVYVLGHKHVLGPSQAHFSPRLAVRAKMSLSRAQNMFMPKNINYIVLIT